MSKRAKLRYFYELMRDWERDKLAGETVTHWKFKDRKQDVSRSEHIYWLYNEELLRL